MRRVIFVWLPTFATDRAFGRPPVSPAPGEAAATFASGRAGLILAAINDGAKAAGLRPGLPLADARAVLPALRLARADAKGDHKRLAALADAARRYTPWTAVDEGEAGPFGGGAGLALDISGCAHLFGGEAGLIADLLGRLRDAGFAAVAAAADTIGAAAAVARFGAPAPFTIVPVGGQVAALASLSVAALRLPAASIDGLYQLGLRRIGDLLPLPRAPLAARFGEAVVRRLDQALGRAAEPLSPRRPVPPFLARRVFAEPIGRPEDIAAALRLLLAELCRQLASAHRGARRLTLTAHHPDGGNAEVSIGTSRPNRDPEHVARLFRDKLAALDHGFGIEVLVLAAITAEPLAPSQWLIGKGAAEDDTLAALIDRLTNRLGEDRVLRLAERESHVPERASYAVPAARGGPCPPLAAAPAQARPPLLLAAPEPVEVVATLPEGAPALIRWRGRARRIVAAEGPERIAPEWWRSDDGSGGEFRDYYRIEDEGGVRLWVYRRGPYRPDRPPRWFVHGLFG